MEKSFVYGIAVTDYNFTGRTEETRRLKSNFIAGINSVLISPRRYGKTSLVDHVCRNLDREDIIIVRLDIFGCKTEYEFYNALAVAVLKQTASKIQLWMEEARDFLVRLTPKIGIPVDPVSEISVSLGITPRLRSAWQHHHYTSYCLYGSKRHMMSNIFLNRSMPFYQFGDLLWLQKIPTCDWMDYIINHFEAEGKHVSQQIVERICEVVDNYPSYVQHLSSILLNHLPQGGSVTDDMMSSAVSELISTNEALYMQQVEPLSAYQMNLLKAIVSGIHSGYNEKRVRSLFDLGSPSNLVRLRDALIERDLIYSEMRQLYLTDPVFGLWFRRRFL